MLVYSNPGNLGDYQFSRSMWIRATGVESPTHTLRFTPVCEGTSPISAGTIVVVTFLRYLSSGRLQWIIVYEIKRSPARTPRFAFYRLLIRQLEPDANPHLSIPALLRGLPPLKASLLKHVVERAALSRFFLLVLAPLLVGAPQGLYPDLAFGLPQQREGPIMDLSRVPVSVQRVHRREPTDSLANDGKRKPHLSVRSRPRVDLFQGRWLPPRRLATQSEAKDEP
jgi:hypothetical protein